MLELQDAYLWVGPDEGGRALLSGVTASYPQSHFGAIIGPSGCGKTSVLKLIAGIAPGRESGEVRWKGRSLHDQDFHGSEISYVPQFVVGHEELTVRECVHYALSLRVAGLAESTRRQRVVALLDEVGLVEQSGQLMRTLSGGQRRRLAMACELTSSPDILLCDEVTSGLDLRAEDEIVRLLRYQASSAGRLVLTVTHSLEHLEGYDSVLVLYQGVVAYHGRPAELNSYFEVDTPAELYGCLENLTAAEWNERWRHERPEPLPGNGVEVFKEVSALPQPGSQLATLLKRRLVIFARSKSQVVLQLAFIFGFPLLVSLFAWNGLPAIENMSLGLGSTGLREFEEARDFLIQSNRIGGLVSGLVMFQVILLTLMGANNSSREIASERDVFEKEKLSGLSPLAYVASKAVFLFMLVAVQSVWMGVFVHRICGFPGDLAGQIGFLLLVNLAVTSICLAISANLRSAEQASLVSIYLVGFQLPLSGAVLALPEPLGAWLRPAISAYWGWSGILHTLKGERCHDAVLSVAQSPLAPPLLCFWILGAHTLVGLAAAWVGCERRRTGSF